MLDEIINVCSQENNLTNLQIKSFMIAIAGVLKGKGDHKPQIPDVMVDQKFQEQRDKQKQSIRIELQKINKKINNISEQLKKQSETKLSMNTLNNFQQKIKKDILMSIAKLQQNFKQEINKVSKLLKQPNFINSPSAKKEQKKQYAESKQQNKIKDSAFNLEKWLHISSQNNNIELKDNTITARNNSFAFGTTKLQGKTYFKVRFNKIVNYVGVGVNQQNLNTLRNWLTYYSNKVCYDENGYRGLQGNGYREGQVVTIQIDKNQGTMQWIVGSQVRHKIKAKILTDQKVHHVPFIQFVTAGDSVSILD